MRRRVLVYAVLVCGLTASNASAQWIQNMARRAGVGASVGGVFTLDDDVNVGVAYGFNFGFAPEPGLSPTMGFGWYEGDLTLTGPLANRDIGRLRVRPLMAGIGYTWVNGKIATNVSINAGVSFNSIRLSQELRDAFGGQVSVDSGNSFCVRPQIRFEYSVAPKVGVFTSAGFFFTEFDNEIQTPLGNFENEWDASSFNLFVGVMVYPFRN
jgi:hypothetical protein